ncbi:MAG: hypothetical protein GWN99_15105 [Gemmatimonadetes bacterium]|uniref:ZU5 domain-containing protein n=1 Tax=Candidatus Kutchimonas denitrificans TaxID=3056748 RepID=A0AAE4Z9P7_9BACT|nr:hypothetical protein [Gemmatimonadota bacterium]NIR76355.1 hypothetical protein [Candidatus Kutchimonas denitrificans]NIS02376.1 hypothetical protein [Gemmatimonadota bacterium]NIT68198.1 hypothetical protein [Gemmatimonadota bacterium]NIY36775.1 hypothetical protein [Gemmatimonadota bacterium]
MIALPITLTACGSDGDPTGPSSTTVDAEGGTLTFAEGKVTLVFPAGAVSEAVTITVKSSTAFPSNERLVSGTVYDFGPANIAFDEPLQLTISYEQAGVPGGIQENELRLYRVAGAGWQTVPGSTPSPGQHRVSGPIDGFSAFAVLGVPIASLTVEPDSEEVVVGSTLQLTATAKDADDNILSSRVVTWSSSSDQVASVDANGLVTVAGKGSAMITAEAEGVSDAARVIAVGATVSIQITSGPTDPRQGDVVVYVAETRDSDGEPTEDHSLTWSLAPGEAGLITAEGRFVGYLPLAAKVVATASDVSDTLDIVIGDRGLSGSFSVVGRGIQTSRWTSDLWLYGDYAYTGTWAYREATGNYGDVMYAWNVNNPVSPVLTDSVTVVGTRWLNDVKISADGSMAVITREQCSPCGIILLDLADPAHPSVITDYTDHLEAGVHNVWIDGSYVYAAANGLTEDDGGLRIIDVSTPSTPFEAAYFFEEAVTANDYQSFIHDVYVRNGLAFVSHWDAGLIILDVGAGVANGSPTNPVEVGRIAFDEGDTHNAWYWPETGYVFVGEEDFFPSPYGKVYVVDARDLANPVQVATFRGIDWNPPHNFWLDEDQGILYAAWYSEGIRAIDVSGELLGELDQQGRQIARLLYDGLEDNVYSCPGGSGTCTWAPQHHNGYVFVSDINSALWVLQLTN